MRLFSKERKGRCVAALSSLGKDKEWSPAGTNTGGLNGCHAKCTRSHSDQKRARLTLQRAGDCWPSDAANEPRVECIFCFPYEQSSWEVKWKVKCAVPPSLIQTEQPPENARLAAS